MNSRTANLSRQTKETNVEVEVDLDGTGKAEISSGIGFYDHLLESFTKHSRINCRLSCVGDTEIDDHHSVEDCALVLGKALNEALGERNSIMRFGSTYAPLDEALVRSVIDLSGRPFSLIRLDFQTERIGDLSTQNISHALKSLASELRMTLHIDQIRGENDHHIAEAAFKALALAFRQSISITSFKDVPSTKGVLA